MRNRVLVVSVLGCLAAVVIWHRATRRREGAAAPIAAAGPAAASNSSVEEARTPLRLPSAAERSDELIQEIAESLRRDGMDVRSHVANDLLPGLIAANAPAAGRLAAKWANAAQREWLLREVARRWSAADCAAAIRWVGSLENGQDRQFAAESVVTQIAQLDPAGALVAAQLFNVGSDDGSQEHIAQIWTEGSPVEAVDWISKRPPSEQRDRLVARIARVRAEREPAEAATLVFNLMPSGPARDDAITTVARQWGERDPNAATLWAQQLPSAGLREGCLAAIAAARKNR